MIGVACRDGPGLPAGTVNDKEKKLIADMLPDLKAQVRPRSLPPAALSSIHVLPLLLWQQHRLQCRAFLAMHLFTSREKCAVTQMWALTAAAAAADSWGQAAKGVEWAKANLK
jgi:hypothetical protein